MIKKIAMEMVGSMKIQELNQMIIHTFENWRCILNNSSVYWSHVITINTHADYLYYLYLKVKLQAAGCSYNFYFFIKYLR